jgi:hypothetical protein
MHGTRMPEVQQAGERVGAVGPVETPYEAGHPDYVGPPPTTVSESGGFGYERRFLAWWHGRSVRRRRLYLLTGGASAVGVLWTAALLGHPTAPPAAPAPVPYPAQAARVGYSGLVQGSGPGAAQFTVLLTVTDTSDATLSVDQVGQPYGGVSATTAQLLPLRVFPGAPQAVWVQMTVRSCSLTPRADLLPFIDVTFSNVQAIQTQSEILGSAYAKDLHAAILKACPTSAADSGDIARAVISPAP